MFSGIVLPFLKKMVLNRRAIEYIGIGFLFLFLFFQVKYLKHKLHNSDIIINNQKKQIQVLQDSIKSYNRKMRILERNIRIISDAQIRLKHTEKVKLTKLNELLRLVPQGQKSIDIKTQRKIMQNLNELVSGFNDE